MHTLTNGIGGLKAAKLLHQSLLENLMRLPVSTFFDVTPIGRILARFSSDVNVVDAVLPHLFHMWFPNIFRVSNHIPFICVIVTTAVIKQFYEVTSGEGKLFGLRVDL